MRQLQSSCSLLVIPGLLFAAVVGRSADSGPVDPIAAALASPQRPAGDRARDARDRPAEVLAFLGAKPGLRALDVNAATGYYTEVLARVVGARGHVISHNHPGAEAMLGEEALYGRYRDDRLPNVETVLLRHDALRFPPQSLDFVLMSMVYHDLYWSGPGVDWGPVDAPALLRGLYEALRPGGVVGVIDHAAEPRTDPQDTAVQLHRIDPDIVREDFLRAGFVLEAHSDLLRNPGDDHSRQVFDPAIHGRTDRFVMRFVKPAGWTLPAGVPPPRVPADAPMTPERVELGRYLFYDARLSGNGTQACSHCHFQRLAFTDGRARSIGSTGQVHPRSSMSLVNSAYRDALTWADPSLLVLEQQVPLPLFSQSPVEMGLAGHEERAFARLRRDRIYEPLFAAAFPGESDPVNARNVTLALAAFVRSIVSFRSPYDRYRFAGDEGALSPAARRGLEVFFGQEARCGGCHLGQEAPLDLGLNLDGGSRALTSPDDEPAVFTFHNTGLYNLPGPVSYPADNTGLYEHTGKLEDVGRFRIPSLRNVAVTRPYMHDGSIATLEAVLDHYAAGGRAPGAQNRSTLIRPVKLGAQQRSDLIAFLESLTDAESLRDPRWGDPWPDATPVPEN